LFSYAYGPGSLHKHVEAAEQAGAEVHLYDSDTLALDVDIPEDLDLYRERLMAYQVSEPAWPGTL
jgi:2-phospho-L-lactate guanylyltransferase (CobY/MobA/RfbA family)